MLTFCLSAVCLHFAGTAYGVTDFEYAKTSEVRENYMDNDLDKIDREPGFQLWFHEKKNILFLKIKKIQKVHIKNRFGVNVSNCNIAILLEKLLSVHTIKRSQIQVLTYTFDWLEILCMPYCFTLYYLISL